MFNNSCIYGGGVVTKINMTFGAVDLSSWHNLFQIYNRWRSPERLGGPVPGTSNRCTNTDVIHEGEKWNHDERAGRSFMRGHRLVDKKKKKAPEQTHKHTIWHTHTHTHKQAEHAGCLETSSGSPSHTRSVKSPQAQDPSRKCWEISHFLLAFNELCLSTSPVLWVLFLNPVQQTTH